MKLIQKVKIMVAVAVATILPLVAVGPVRAMSYKCPDGKDTTDVGDCTGQSGDTNLMGTVGTIINVIIGALGVVAVAVIVFGGVQYTISVGDAGKVKKAKDTIMYGIIGLVVALLAYAIVNFVLSGVFTSGS